MAVLKLHVELPDRLAREARAAGLLTATAVTKLLREAMRRQAGQVLLKATKQSAKTRTAPLSLHAIQAEVNAVRAGRKTRILG
jgi:hypothetical protein